MSSLTQTTLEAPASARDEFARIIQDALDRFGKTHLVQKLKRGEFTLADYHQALLMIFHQTYNSPSAFALAAGICSPSFQVAREYLMQHADEEKLHWKWVISDLTSTGYTGPDPRTTYPSVACQAYVAFDFYVALRNPLGRLAIAAVLESIGANNGVKSAAEICRQLGLTLDQVQFFHGHGDTDVGHTADLLRVLDECDLAESEWADLGNIARTAGVLYCAMYEQQGA